MIGDRLKQARLQMGLTQEQVGKLINRSKPFVCEAEASRAMLTPDQITALASALGVEKEWLTTGEGDMTPNESSRDRRSIGERVYALRRSKQLNQTQFAHLLGVSRNTISLLERRKINASQAMIAAVVGKCKVSEKWLRSGESESRAEEIIDWLRGNQADKARVREWLLNDSSSDHQDSW